MSTPKRPNPEEILTALGLLFVASLALCGIAMMLIDVVAYGMEKLS